MKVSHVTTIKDTGIVNAKLDRRVPDLLWWNVGKLLVVRLGVVRREKRAFLVPLTGTSVAEDRKVSCSSGP